MQGLMRTRRAEALAAKLEIIERKKATTDPDICLSHAKMLAL